MSKSAKRIFRPLWLVLGFISIATGFVGIFLPVLPTTPLMILAAFCFSKSSPRFEAMLLNHKTFGPVILDWREKGAIAPNIKLVAIGTMVAVFVLSLVLEVKVSVLVIQFVCLSAAAAFIVTRPNA